MQHCGANEVSIDACQRHSGTRFDPVVEQSMRGEDGESSAVDSRDEHAGIEGVDMGPWKCA